MIRYAFITLLILALALFGSVSVARAQLPYGGNTAIAIPCTVTPGIFLVYTVPVAGPNNFLYTAAQVIDADDPNHLVPSFLLLGLHAPAVAPCLVWLPCPPLGEPCPVVIGVGFPVEL